MGKKDNFWYIFEIKHRNKLVSYKDVDDFLKKIKKSEFKNKKIKLFFISKSGFTEQAELLYQKSKINFLER